MLAAGVGKVTDGAGAALNAGGAVTDKATGGCFGFGGKKVNRCLKKEANKAIKTLRAIKKSKNKNSKRNEGKR